MKRNLIVLLACLLIVAVGVMTAQDKMNGEKKMTSKEKETTIVGEVVDVACYLHKGAKGDAHKGCAEGCASAGGALGILTEKGKLYISILPDDHKNGPNAILMDHVAQNVKATGMVRSKSGIDGIMITKVEMAEEMKK